MKKLTKEEGEVLKRIAEKLGKRTEEISEICRQLSAAVRRATMEMRELLNLLVKEELLDEEKKERKD